MKKLIISGLMLLTFAGVLFVFAGDLTTDNLTVYKDATFYGNVQTLQATATTNGNVLRYSFNTQNGTNVTDESGYGQTGCVYGVVWTNYGYSGASYLFSTSNDYITVPASTNWVFRTNNFSVSFWMQRTVHDFRRPLVNNRKYPGSSGEWTIEIYNVTNRLEVHSGTTILLTSSVLLSTSTWNSVILTRYGGYLNLYINGSLGGSVANTADLNETNDLQIGRDIMGNAVNDLWGKAYAGYLDELVIYNRGLSTNEIQQIYTAGRANAGGFSVNSITSSNSISQTSSFATNTFMGRVGLGTGTPDAGSMLDVAGNARVQGTNVVGALSLGGQTRTNWPAGAETWAQYPASTNVSAGNRTVTVGTLIVNNTATFNSSISLVGTTRTDNTTGMVLFYNFASNTNVIQDLSGYGHYGSSSGAIWTASGRTNGAYSFDATNDWIQTPSTVALSPTNQLTIMAWIKLDTAISNTYPMIVTKNPSSGAATYLPGNYEFRVNNNGVLYFQSQYTTNASQSASGVSRVDNLAWHMVGVTVDASSKLVRLYVDGRLDKSQVMANRPIAFTNAEPVRIGRRKDGYYYDGLIDEVRIYNRALTPEEMTQVYAFYMQEKNTAVLTADRFNQTGFLQTNVFMGNVGIGTNRATNALNVAGTASATFFVGNGSMLTSLAGGNIANASIVSTKLANNTITATQISTNSVLVGVNADMVDGMHATNFALASQGAKFDLLSRVISLSNGVFSTAENFDTGWSNLPWSVFQTNVLNSQSRWLVNNAMITNAVTNQSAPYVCILKESSSSNAWVRSPLLTNGYSSLTFGLKASITNRPIVIAIEANYEGTNWVSQGTYSNASMNVNWCTFTNPSTSARMYSSQYLRLRKLTESTNTLSRVSLDSVSIVSPVPNVIASAMQVSNIVGRVNFSGASVTGLSLAASSISGLGSAATMDAASFATASQGVKADNAVQRAGDAMTGTLQLPVDGLNVGGNQIAMYSGMVGIGTEWPSEKLHVAGNLQVDGVIVGLGSAANYSTSYFARANQGLVALQSSGQVIMWGSNYAYNVLNVPPDASNSVVAIESQTLICLALRSDGRVVQWGSMSNVPSDASNSVVAIDAGDSHSMALRSDGRVVQWNSSGLIGVPPGASNSVVAIADGALVSLAVRSNGQLVAWGMQPPPDASNSVVAVAAGSYVSMALRSDGRVVAWGNNYYGECNVPPDASNSVVAIACGEQHCLALRSDGRLVAWGYNLSGECDVPEDAANAVAIAAGNYSSIALRPDGRVVMWGNNFFLNCDVPMEASNSVVAIAGGYSHSMAVVGTKQRQAVSGDMFVTGGVLTASTFIGNGSQITNISGASLQIASVTSNQIANGSITGVKIASSAIDSSKIQDGQVLMADIGNAQVTGIKLANNTVTVTNIANGAVTTAKLDIASIDVRYVNATGDVMIGTLNMTNNRIINLGMPVSSNDAVTKAYVDQNTLTNNGSGVLGSLSVTGLPFSTTSMALWYKYSVSNTLVEDLSGNSNVGIVSGATWTPDGCNGGSYIFSGISNSIIANNSSSLNINSQLSIMVWAKVNVTSVVIPLVNKQPSYGAGNNHAGNYEFSISSGKPSFGYQYTAGSATEIIAGEGIVDDGKWHCMAVTVDAASRAVKFYVDGVLTKSTVASYTPMQQLNTEPVRIGIRKDAFTYNGVIIDEVCVYRKILTDSEISGMYGGGTFRVNSDQLVAVGGKIGIGTNTPAEKLHVAGNIRVDGAINTPAGNMVLNSGSAYGSTIDFKLHNILSARLSEDVMTLYGTAYEINPGTGSFPEGYFRVASNNQAAVLCAGPYLEGSSFFALGSDYLGFEPYVNRGSAIAVLNCQGAEFSVLDADAFTNRFRVTKDGRVFIGNAQIGDSTGLLLSALPSQVLTNGATISTEGISLKYQGPAPTLVARTNSTVQTWWLLASSADGLKLAASPMWGYIYTSTDGGVNWIARTNSGTRGWWALASSADGLKLAAGEYGGSLVTSSDGGATWITRTNAGSRAWSALASSADGTKLAASVDSGYLCTSVDGGATWTERISAGARAWFPMASSTDGTKLVAAAYGGEYIYTSTDGGANWTPRTDAGAQNWYAIACSADGQKVVAVPFGGYVYTSSDGGATWTEVSSLGVKSWASAAMSSDGSKIVVGAENDFINTSIDGGVTWTSDQLSGAKAWYALASSSDGSKIAGAACSDYIHTTGYVMQDMTQVVDRANITLKSDDWTNTVAGVSSASITNGVARALTAIQQNGSTAMTGDLNMGSNRIINVNAIILNMASGDISMGTYTNRP